MKEKTKRLSRQEELFFALGFSQHDLELNRKGILSERQVEMVWRHERIIHKAPLAIFGFLASFCTIAFLIFLNIATKFEHLPLLSTSFPLIIFLFPSSLISWWLLGELWKLRSDLKAKKLKQIEGLAIVDLGGERRAASFSINGHYLRVNHATLLRIKHLEPHRVYYLPHSKAVVAVEVMENEDAIGENESLSYTSIHPKSKNK